jgi:hypothetical protein
MIRTAALTLAILCFAWLAFSPGCGDDNGGDGKTSCGGPQACCEMIDLVHGAIDQVCADYPDCSICEPYEYPEGDWPTAEECQENLDQIDHDQIVEGYSLVCEMEEGTGTDEECDPPSGVSDWSGPCDPEQADCPADQYCISINGLDDTAGYCAPLCCEGDSTYCEDIGTGDEQCLVSSQEDDWWCVVVCESNDDCVEGTTCQLVPDTSTSICYAGSDTDTDSETDTDPCDGYTGTDECCLNNNPCDWALNDICDCDSTCAWDAVDCEW